jgi:hypothetical protein
MNVNRKLAIFAGIGLALGLATPIPRAEAAPQVSLGVSIGIAPPPLRYERVPAPRYGYDWAPGYWRWGGDGYIWVVGRWYPHRAGYVYVAPRWEHYDNDWRFHRSHWRPRTVVHERVIYRGGRGHHDYGRHGRGHGRGHHGR